MRIPMLFGLSILAVASAIDEACTIIGGTCQSDNNKCSGSYYTGKCSGPTNRRCCTPTAVAQSTNFCPGITIISRDSWGARRPTSVSTLSTPVKDFFIHHTESGTCSAFLSCVSAVKAIQNYHMDSKGWSDIGYSFLVGGDGRIYEGRGWNTVGAHTLNYNSISLAASFIGSFMSSTPTASALTAVKSLIQCGINNGKISTNYALFGHRDVGSTDCPGTALYNIIKTWPRFHEHPAK